MKTPKISVVVTAYNHEKYIAQCLDSILMQKGSFELEIIFGDDCSRDKTRQIMQEYQLKYPDIIALLPQTANMGPPKNAKRCLAACSGDYIVFCDGDDYLTDTYKLQKQLEFLESHPDYALCFNAVMLYFEDANRYAPHSGQLLLKKNTLTTADLIENNCIGSACSCMHRASIVRKLPEGIFDNWFGDWKLNMACGRLGKIGFIRDWMTVYRIHSAGAWSGKSHLDQFRELYQAIDSYNHFFSYEYDKQFRKKKETIKKQIDEYEKQLQGLSRQVSLVKLYVPLFIRAIRHPKKAYNKLTKILSSTIAELTPGVSARDSQIAKLASSVSASLIIESAPSGKLNVGCGKVKLPGWVNIDIEPGADLVIDVREGLPFNDNSVDFIYNEHFVEHLTYEECEKVLREFWRCLKKGGVLRIAAPDLDFIIQIYDRDFKNQDWFPAGFEFVKTKGMAMNMAFRSWGHKFLYNEEELTGQLIKVGFQNIKRCELNKSNYPELSNLETRKESTLILEAVKE